MVDAGHEPSPWIPAPIRWGVLAVLTVLFVGIGFQQARLDAPAVDEGVDVSSGVAALVHRDLRMVPEHPALPKALGSNQTFSYRAASSTQVFKAPTSLLMKS